jgi:tetratricopeptide (TPR) repeat protein
MTTLPGLEQRARTTTTQGPASTDDVWLTAACACGLVDAVTGPTSVHPDLIEGLHDLAARVRARAAAPGPQCPRCGALTRVVAVRHHTFAREVGRDLVVLWTADAPDEVALRWWDLRGGEEPADVAPEVDTGLARDAALRHVEALLAIGQRASALAVARRLLERHPRDPAILALLPSLAGTGPQGWALACAIVDGQGDRAEAARALARTTLEAVRRGALDPAALDGALAALATLEGAPTTTDDELLRAQILQALRHFDAARAAFEAVAAREPACAAAYQALGELAEDPADALAHHARAEAVAPADAEHPLGQARALLRLGRLAEAAAAVERARALAPELPRLRRVEHELRRRSGEAPPEGPRVALEVVGLDVWGEATLERGVLALRHEGEPPDDAVRDLCCTLGIVQGSVLARDAGGDPLRLYQVEGDGACVRLATHDDDEAVREFAAEFAALWDETDQRPGSS